MKTWTIRLPDALDEWLTIYAKKEDISKNQAIKKALEMLMKLDKATGEELIWQIRIK